MTNNQFSSIWDAIEDNRDEAENMKLKSSLMSALREYITNSGFEQAEAARSFGVTQPRISDLMRGKINLFSLDYLVAMAVRAGFQVDLQLKKAV